MLGGVGRAVSDDRPYPIRGITLSYRQCRALAYFVFLTSAPLCATRQDSVRDLPGFCRAGTAYQSPACRWARSIVFFLPPSPPLAADLNVRNRSPDSHVQVHN